jgi:hypothetical protein
MAVSVERMASMDSGTGGTILGIVSIAVPAVAGLAGVLMGAWLTGRSQRQDRRQAWLRRQLDEFYSPMFGMRARILAKSSSREKVEKAAEAAWNRLLPGSDREGQRELELKAVVWMQAIISDNNRQLAEELLPMYRKMVDDFSEHLGLAEPETRTYYGDFVHFVDVWDRHLRGVLPGEVSAELGHREAALHPFYRDLADHMERLQKELKKG